MRHEVRSTRWEVRGARCEARGARYEVRGVGVAWWLRSALREPQDERDGEFCDGEERAAAGHSLHRRASGRANG